MTRRHAPAADQAHRGPRKGRLIGGTGCKKGHPTDCEQCPLPDCDWTPEEWKRTLDDIEELLEEITEEVAHDKPA